MAKQHFLEILPFVATIAILALFATVGLTRSRSAPDIYPKGNTQAKTAPASLDQASGEVMLVDAMWALSRR